MQHLQYHQGYRWKMYSIVKYSDLQYDSYGILAEMPSHYHEASEVLHFIIRVKESLSDFVIVPTKWQLIVVLKFNTVESETTELEGNLDILGCYINIREGILKKRNLITLQTAT